MVTSSSNLIKSEEIVGKSSEKPLLYEGTTVITDPKNPLVLPILHAESTAYSYKPDLPVKDVSFLNNNCLFDNCLYSQSFLVFTWYWQRFIIDSSSTSKK